MVLLLILTEISPFHAPLNSILEISYVGFQSKEVTVSSNAPLVIVLETNDKILDEVIGSRLRY